MRWPVDNPREFCLRDSLSRRSFAVSEGNSSLYF
jgi:hypothetical protein